MVGTGFISWVPFTMEFFFAQELPRLNLMFLLILEQILTTLAEYDICFNTCWVSSFQAVDGTLQLRAELNYGMCV